MDKEEKLIDLHAHTKYSDGELAPDDLIKLAIKRNIGTLAITDHDTIKGIKSVDKNSPFITDSGIKIINGIELTAKVPKGRMHILGYDLDINSKKLNDKMAELQNNSINSVLTIMKQVTKDYGIKFKDEDVEKLIKANHNVGRPDIAKLLMKYGYVKTSQEAFDKYLIAAFDKTRGNTRKLSYVDCLNLITDNGGIPVLAHPKSLELNEKDFLVLLKDMIKNGLQGIEVFHSTHTKEEMKYYESVAKKYNLLISGGSDYHGPIVKPNVELGSGKNNNIKIKKLSLLDRINSRKYN